MPPLEQIGLEIILKGSRLYFADVNKAIQVNALLATSLGKAAVASTANAAAQLTSAPAIQRVANGVGVLNTVATKATAIQKSFGRSLIAATGFSNRFGVSLLFGAQALTAFSAAFTISAASKYQDSLARIDNLTNLTRADTEALGKQILLLTKTVPQSPDDLGAAAYQILSSGINDVDLAFQLLQQSAKAATGLFTNTEVVAKTLTSVLEAYKGTGLDAAEITDILVAAIREGRAEPEAFAEQLGNVIGLATNLGVTFDELSGSLAVLTNTGLPAAQAMTGIRGILNAINDPADSAHEIFVALGTSATQLRKNIREGGLIAAFEDLAKRGGDNRQALAEFFPEVRGLNAFLSGFTTNLSKTAEVFNRIKNSSGATENAFKRAKETFSTQASLLRNVLNVALINLGTTILPTLTKAIQDLLGWIEKNKEGISAFADAAIRVGAQLGSAFITTIKAIIELTKAIGGNKAVLAGLAIAFILVVAAIAPIPLAIVSIITAIGLLIQNWDKLKNKTIDVWNSIPDIIRKPLEFIANDAFAKGKAIVDGVIHAFQLLKSVVKTVMAVLSGDWDKAWAGLQKTAGLAAKLVVDAVVTAFGLLPNLLISITEKAVNGIISGLNAASKAAADFKILGEDVNPIPATNIKPIELPRIRASSIPGISKENAEAIDAQTDANKKANEEAVEGAHDFDRLTDSLKDSAIGADNAKKLTDALSDGIISFAEAAELGLDAIGAGALEATIITREAEEEAFDFAKTLSKVANAFRVSTQAANKLILSLAREALAKVKAAQAELFGQPTKEVAQLNLDIANLQLKQAQVSERITPEIERLQDQLDDLNKIEPADSGGEATTQTVAAVIQQGLQGGMGALNAQAGLTADELDNLKKNVQDKIDILERELELVDREIGAIERRKAIYEAETNILQARIELENALLKTQSEQKTAAEELIVSMQDASSAVVRFAEAAGEDTLESFNEMRKAIALLKEAITLADDPALRMKFTPAVEAGAEQIVKMNKAASDFTDTLVGSIDRVKSLFDFKTEIGLEGTKDLFSQGIERPESVQEFIDTHPVDSAVDELAESLRRGVSLFDQQLQGVGTNATQIGSRQHGGFIHSPEIAKLHPPELILPLNDATRSRELLQALPAHLRNSQQPNQLNGSLFGDIVVNGDSPETTRRMIHTEIDRRLDQQRRGFHRQGL